MGFRITNTESAAKVVASQKSKKMLGKDNLELNKEYVLLFPKKNNKVVVSGIVGRGCSHKDLGFTFARIADSQMEVNEETGRIKDNSGMGTWAMLSNILYKASQRKEEKEAEQNAINMANLTGAKVDDVALRQQLEKIDIAYNGRPKVGDEQAILPSRSRLVSSSVQFSIFTEAVLIPLDKELKPEFDKASGVEVSLSPTKVEQINGILKNSNYNNMDDPDGFLEIKFSYMGKDRKEAGKNKYMGVEPAVRKVNFSKDDNGEYVDNGTRMIAHLLNNTSHSDEMMFSRSGTVSFAKTSADLEAAMRKFLASNKILSAYIDLEAEDVKRNAKTIMDLNCVFGKDTKQYKELLEIIQEQEADSDEQQEEDTVSADLNKLKEAKDTEELEEAMKGNEELASMISDDEISDI